MVIIPPVLFIVIGGDTRIGLLHVENNSVEDENSLKIREIKNDFSNSPVVHITWSPESVFDQEESNLCYAVICLDHVIRIRRNDQEIVELNGHQDYINSFSFGTDGTLASVSDDKTCKIWVGKL